MSESPLRQQIAEAIHKWLCDACVAGPPEWHCEPDDISGDESRYFWAADAVVALLNLTEELGQRYSEEGSASGDVVLPGVDLKFPGGYVVHRYCTPWLPSTPPDTSSSEPA